MTFSLLTLNLRHGQGPRVPGEQKNWYFGRGAAAMRRNAAAIGELLKRTAPQPDIVCLQETNAAAFFWPNITGIIRERAGYAHVAEASARVLPHNNAILSRFPFQRVVSRQFRNLPVIAAGWRGIRYSMNRGFIAAEIEGIGLVVSTHLDPYLPALRLRQARELRTTVRGRGAIIAGDLNPEHWDEESLQALGEGFSTVPPLAAGQFSSFATWPAGSSSSGVVPEQRFDYLFVSPDFRMVSAERILTGLTDHAGVLAIIASA